MTKLLIFLTFTMSIPVMACTVQTIVTDNGLVSCYTCPDKPPYCTGI